MKDYQIRTTRIHILPKGDALFSPFATAIEIEDEAAGEYLKITQQADTDESMNQQICIDPEDWEILKTGIEMMLQMIKLNEEDQP